MEMVLGGHPVLTVVDRDSIVKVLKALYVEHRAEMDEEYLHSRLRAPPGTPHPDRD